MKAYKHVEKETFIDKVSFFLVQEKDSIVINKFLKINKLYKESNYTVSLEECFDLLKLELDIETEFKTNFLIAEIYRKINNHSNSILFYKKAEAILDQNEKSSKDFIRKTFDTQNLAKTYLRLGGEYLRKSIKDKDTLNNYRDRDRDSSKYYYNKVLNVNSVNNKVLSYQGSASTNLSGLYMQDYKYDLAKEYAVKSVNIHQKRNNKISEAAAKGSLAGIYLDQKNYKESKHIYIEALDLIKDDKSDYSLKVKEKIYYNLAYNLYLLEDFEAYMYQELSYEIKDALRDKEIRRMIEELRFKYNFDAQKELFQEQEEVKRLRDQRIFWSIGIIALLIIVSLVYWLNIYKLKQHNLALKLNQVELLQNQNLDKLKSETQVRILNATIDGKESERKEIAETLHDSVSALLSSANLHLQATRKQFNGKTPIEIDKTQQIIQEASYKIRDLSHTLVSSVLLKFGLNFAIKDIAEKYSNSQLNIATDIRNIRRYQQNFEIKVYNITQEFINNILKHSKADNALIEFKEESNKLFITISDDGVGFDKTKINTKNGLGINQIDARIQMMKGRFQIESSKNNGTKISVELPILRRKTLTS
jgi:two-component system NarL family sensor kinase